jgi:acyl-coenzyme A thioesterase 9
MPIRTPGLYSEHLSHPIPAAASPSQPSPASADPSATPPTRTMHDSYSEVVLPLRSNATLFEQFINANGGIRTGKLMEHLDSLAGSIAYKHILGSDVQSLGSIEDRGLYVVTAAVDRWVSHVTCSVHVDRVIVTPASESICFAQFQQVSLSRTCGLAVT